jgi:hypothetical protein
VLYTTAESIETVIDNYVMVKWLKKIIIATFREREASVEKCVIHMWLIFRNKTEHSMLKTCSHPSPEALGLASCCGCPPVSREVACYGALHVGTLKRCGLRFAPPSLADVGWGRRDLCLTYNKVVIVPSIRLNETAQHAAGQAISVLFVVSTVIYTWFLSGWSLPPRTPK